jgi:hypothetical protein
MTSVAQDRQASRIKAEQAAIDRVIERLATQFPELAPEQIVQSVHGTYEDFDQSTVRDFVPILVERSAREQLVGPARRHRA